MGPQVSGAVISHIVIHRLSLMNVLPSPACGFYSYLGEVYFIGNRKARSTMREFYEPGLEVAL